MENKNYELQLESFSGPLDTLLELIEAKKLEITEISLAAVTDDFLKFIEPLREADLEATDAGFLRRIADFVVIASKLIFIKSKSLLPEFQVSEEDEAEIKDLENRLKFYKELKPAIKNISELWAKQSLSHSRPYFMNLNAPATEAKMFFPGKGITMQALADSLVRIFEVYEKLAVETKVVREKIITLEEKIGEVAQKITEFREMSFEDLSRSKSKAEIIVTFLAILHLAREQLVLLEQEEGNSDIIIKKGERSEKSEFHPNDAN